MEPAYRRQLEFLRKLAMDELRKGLAGLKYNWELVPGLAKVRRTQRVPSHFQAVQSVFRRAAFLVEKTRCRQRKLHFAFPTLSAVGYASFQPV